MSISPDKYNVENARTLSELHRCWKFAASKTKERCGEQEPPLFNIDIDHIVLDELHLLLRIEGVLIRNIVFECLRLDAVLQRSRESPHYINDLQQLIRSCGIGFRVWLVRDPDGKPTSKYDWTTLTGKDTKTLLHKLPPKLATFLPQDISSTVDFCC